MSSLKRYEELLASKLNQRNYSAILPIILNLRKRVQKDYFTSAPNRIVPYSGSVGDTGSTGYFSTISPTYAKGDEITLSGVATYVLTYGANNLVKPATRIVAQIDPKQLQDAAERSKDYQVEMKASEISDLGVFSFKIPSEVTKLLSAGTHYVYLDAFSPNFQTRLYASGTDSKTTDKLYFTRAFNITA